jgi:hypothetical protein
MQFLPILLKSSKLNDREEENKQRITFHDVETVLYKYKIKCFILSTVITNCYQLLYYMISVVPVTEYVCYR